MAKKNKWMQAAFPEKTRGKLHKALGVPKDKNIPTARLESAYNQARKKGDTTRMRQINAAKRGAAISRKHARKHSFSKGVTGK